MMSSHINPSMNFTFLILLLFHLSLVNTQSSFQKLFDDFGNHKGEQLNIARQNCEHLTYSLRNAKFTDDTNEVFPQQLPGVLNGGGKELARLRIFGEECDPDLEEKYYKELYDFWKTDPSVVSGDSRTTLAIGKEWYQKNWAMTYKNYTNLKPISKLCNPRWFLQCDPDKKTCGCIKDRGFEQENATDSICFNHGNCEKTYNLNYRCVKSFHSSCEYFMPPVGVCLVNCQLGLECMGTSLNGTKQCCDVKTRCNPRLEEASNKNAGSILYHQMFNIYLLFMALKYFATPLFSI